jgi:hypothetical protein
MYIRHQAITTLAISFAFFLVLSWASVPAQTVQPVQLQDDSVFTLDPDLQQFQNEADRRNKIVSPPSIRPMPETVSQPAATEKQCMVVCARWGEDCTYNDRGIGGTTRDCRRTCQQFSEECF